MVGIYKPRTILEVVREYKTIVSQKAVKEATMAISEYQGKEGIWHNLM